MALTASCQLRITNAAAKSFPPPAGITPIAVFGPRASCASSCSVPSPPMATNFAAPSAILARASRRNCSGESVSMSRTAKSSFSKAARTSGTLRPALPEPARAFRRMVTPELGSPARFGSEGRMRASLSQPAAPRNRRLALRVLLEPRLFQAFSDLRILRKLLPNKAAARVFRHHDGDSGIDAERVGTGPVVQRIEGVHVAVPSPHTLAEFGPDILQHAHALLRQEHQRTRRGARNDAAVDSPHGRGPAPDGVPVFRVRSAHAPQIVGIVGKALRQLHTPQLVDLGGYNRVCEIVAVLVVNSAKAEPGVRILMR